MSSDSDKCKESKSKKSKNKHKTKFAILNITNLRKYKFDELLDYIKTLHEFLEKKDKKLQKYKDKLKKFDKKSSKDEKVKKEITTKNVDFTTNTNTTNSKDQSPENKVDLVEDSKEPLSFLDEIREAAEIAQNKNGFIYEPTSGLYYDQSTGYYYNAEYGLYYNGHTGCYYKLNPDTNEFDFHSQVEIERNDKEKGENDEIEKRKYQKYKDKLSYYSDDNSYDDYYYKNNNNNRNNRNHRDRKKRYTNSYKKSHHRRNKMIKYDDHDNEHSNNDYEDGEILSESSDEGKKFLNPVESKNYDSEKYEDIAKKYPPSLRIVVQETNLEKIQVGTLYIITYKGGTLGREGNHDVVIPDINISKFHLKFSYNDDKSLYQCIDLGSRNGTILNGKRMATAKQESELMDIEHGTIIQISQTKLLCHIHSGTTTCNLCEPGLLIEPKIDEKVTTCLSHKEQLKKLQKRYGLENEKYIETKTNSKYNDRAAVRRVKVGSSSHHEKTQMASTEIAISSENKGFKMLSKLGWSKGETLGKKNDGLLEPIDVAGNTGTKGLGCNEKVINLTKADIKKAETWKKAQERYSKIKKSDIFNDDSGSSD